MRRPALQPLSLRAEPPARMCASVMVAHQSTQQTQQTQFNTFSRKNLTCSSEHCFAGMLPALCWHMSINHQQGEENKKAEGAQPGHVCSSTSSQTKRNSIVC